MQHHDQDQATVLHGRTLTRLRLATRTAHGPALTRRELAALVNEHITRTTGRPGTLDANYIGKLERDVIRRPHQHVRQALHAVLATGNDVRARRARPDDDPDTLALHLLGHLHRTGGAHLAPPAATHLERHLQHWPTAPAHCRALARLALATGRLLRDHDPAHAPGVLTQARTLALLGDDPALAGDACCERALAHLDLADPREALADLDLDDRLHGTAATLHALARARAALGHTRHALHALAAAERAHARSRAVPHPCAARWPGPDPVWLHWARTGTVHLALAGHGADPRTAAALLGTAAHRCAHDADRTRDLGIVLVRLVHAQILCGDTDSATRTARQALSTTTNVASAVLAQTVLSLMRATHHLPSRHRLRGTVRELHLRHRIHLRHHGPAHLADRTQDLRAG